MITDRRQKDHSVVIVVLLVGMFVLGLLGFWFKGEIEKNTVIWCNKYPAKCEDRYRDLSR